MTSGGGKIATEQGRILSCLYDGLLDMNEKNNRFEEKRHEALNMISSVWLISNHLVYY